MLKKITYFIVFTLILGFLAIFFLSNFGIKTDKFNNNISNQLKENYPNLNIEFKEIKLLLNLLNFSINLEAKNPKIFVENKEITWGGGVKGIFYGVHSFLLESITDGKTLLKHNETFSGIAINFADLPPDVIAEGYHEMNVALKKLVETDR